MRPFFRAISLTMLATLSVSGTAHATQETRNLPQNVTLTGTFNQGGMVTGKCPQACTAVFDGKSLKVSNNGDFVFGFGRDAAIAHNLRIKVGHGRDILYPFSIKKRSYDIQRVDGVPQGTVNPPPEVQERIKREQAMVDNARAVASDRIDFLEGFSWPLKGRISGIYGSQRVYNGQPGNPHFGLDIAGPVGKPVQAPMSGKVMLAEPDLYFSGGTVILDHGHGIFSSYIHLSSVDVKVGSEIRRGDILGKVGATGRASGPHLDWRINWFTDRLDPAYTVPPQ